MNQRYTYGYIDGWDVENEYINSQNQIMSVYDTQMKKLEQIRNDIQFIEADINRNHSISEEDIRRWYNEDVVQNNRNKSYESYKKEILEIRDERLNGRRNVGLNTEIIGLNEQVSRKTDEYTANLYYMADVKNEARKAVHKRREYLRTLLEEKNIERSTISLERRKVGIQYDENRNVINTAQINEFGRREAENWLEIRKIEHALSELDKMSEKLQFTEEETNLMMRGLNPQQRRYYDEIDKNPTPTLDLDDHNKQKTYDGNDNSDNDNDRNNDDDQKTNDGSGNGDDGTGNDDGGNNVDDDKQNDDLDITPDNLEIDLSEYEAALSEYDKLLEEYKQELEKLYILQEAYENGKIEYSEYEEYANYMKERYNYVLQKYNEIREMYNKMKELLDEMNVHNSLTLEELTRKIQELEADFNREYQYRVHEENGLNEHDDDFIGEYNKNKKKLQDAIKRKQGKYASLSDEELQQMLEQLEAEFNREYQYRVHEENGLNEHDDDFIVEYNRKKKEIEDELNRRGKKYTLREPEAPEKPRIISEKIIEDQPIEDKKENNMDLDYLIAKIRGRGYKFNKFDGFIYKYKGIKVWNWHKFNGRTFADKPFKLIKTAVASGIFSINKLFSKGVYATAGDLRARIEQMVQNIEKLTNEEIDFIINEYKGNIEVQLYGAVPNVVYEALLSRIRRRKTERVREANALLEILYNQLISEYKQCKEIREMLSNPNLSEEDRKQLNHKYNELSNNLLSIISKLEEVYDNANHLVAEKDYDRQTAKENRFGGRNSGVKDDHEVVDFMGDLGGSLVAARNAKNGYEAAEMFIYKHKLRIENTIYKRTLKNRGGVANVGVYEWRPFIETIDYTHHNYWADAIRSIVIATTIANSINQANMQKEIDNLIAQKNAEITDLNNKITNLQLQLSKYTSNPDAYAEKYAEYLEVQAGMYQASADYFGATAEAGLRGLHSPSMNSNGSMYGPVDALGHTNGPAWINNIRAIKNNTGLTAEQKIAALQRIGENINIECGNLANITKVEALKHIASRANDFDFTAAEAFLGNASSVDPSFLGEALGDIYKIALSVDKIKTLSLIQNFDMTQSTTLLVAQLASIAGVTAIDDHYNKNNLKTDSVDEMKDRLEQEILNVEIDEHEAAKRATQEALDKWNEQGFFYKIFHKKEKPRQVEFEQDEYDKRRGL